MKIIYFAVTLVLTVALLGCGTSNDEPKSTDSPSVSGPDGLEANLTETGEDGRAFQYVLTNHSDSDVTLTFSSGQEFNYILWRKDETETMVYSYEQGRAFTQAFHERTLKPHESITYDIALEEYEPDTYILEAYMTSNEPDQESPAKYRQTLEFTIPD